MHSKEREWKTKDLNCELYNRKLFSIRIHSQVKCTQNYEADNLTFRNGAEFAVFHHQILVFVLARDPCRRKYFLLNELHNKISAVQEQQRTEWSGKSVGGGSRLFQDDIENCGRGEREERAKKPLKSM